MKARVKATGEIVEATLRYGEDGKLWYEIDNSGYFLTDEELDFSFDTEPDYWEKLLHQYAGMAMQGILAKYGVEPLPDDAAHDAYNYAHALVEILKSESNGLE